MRTRFVVLVIALMMLQACTCTVRPTLGSPKLGETGAQVWMVGGTATTIQNHYLVQTSRTAWEYVIEWDCSPCALPKTDVDARATAWPVVRHALENLQYDRPAYATQLQNAKLESFRVVLADGKTTQTVSETFATYLSAVNAEHGGVDALAAVRSADAAVRALYFDRNPAAVQAMFSDEDAKLAGTKVEETLKLSDEQFGKVYKSMVATHVMGLPNGSMMVMYEARTVRRGVAYHLVAMSGSKRDGYRPSGFWLSKTPDAKFTSEIPINKRVEIVASP